MTCPKTEFWLADRLAGRWSESEASRLEEHLRSCPECRAEAESFSGLWDALGEWPDEDPGPDLRRRFDAMLASQGASSPSPLPSGSLATSRFQRQHWLAWAVMIALILGSFAAGRSWQGGPPENGELQALRGEVATLTRLVSLSLLARDSAGQRLRGVAYARQVGPSDSELVDVLIEAVRHDDSVNVRLAAIEALSFFGTDAAPRQEMRTLLTPEQPPMVQIALVDYLLAAPQANDRDVIRRLRGRPDLDHDVATHIDRLLTTTRGQAL